MKIAIIGSGISGLSIANLLKDNYEVTVYENKPAIGGLIKCERVHDCLFHKVGGHVFNAKNTTVFNWFWSFFDIETEFIKTKRNAKVFYDNKIIGYPIENYLYELDRDTVKKIFEELIALQNENQKQPFEYDNFEEFLKGNFGETLFSIYFKPYNHKIWQTDLKEVSMGWLEGKLPMPNFKEIVLSNTLRAEEDTMVHSSFYYPKYNGSQFIVDRLSQGLNIVKGYQYTPADLVNDGLIIDGVTFDHVIYTGDIRQIPSSWKALLNQNDIDVAELENLKSNGTSNLFCETDDNDISWLYIPQNFTLAHRIIYTGNFSSTNNSGSNRKTCVVEFSGKVDYEVMVNEIKKLPGNLTPLSYNYEKNSYVVQGKITRELIQNTKQVLKNKQIYLLGRFAEWEYYNMDKAIEAAMNLADELNNKK